MKFLILDFAGHSNTYVLRVKCNMLFSYYREAISAVCERRGVDVDSINVYLEQSRTPLPLLTTETAWLGGRHIRIRGMYV